MKILITGASGYVGRSVFNAIKKDSSKIVIPVYRSKNSLSEVRKPELIDDVVTITDLTHVEDWTEALEGVDTVIHAAAVVHQKDEIDGKYIFDSNALATQRLATDAEKCGVKQFIFFSTVAVYANNENKILSEDDVLLPETIYGKSKLAAEEYLNDLRSTSTMKILTLRPPMIYGPSCPGNFATLVGLIKKSIPLPLGSIDSNRSLLFIDNLIDLMQLVLSGEALSGTFNVSDNENVTFITMLELVKSGLGVNTVIFKFPLIILKNLTIFIGKSAAIDKISESITLDTTAIRSELGWRAPIKSNQGIIKSAESFLKR